MIGNGVVVSVCVCVFLHACVHVCVCLCAMLCVCVCISVWHLLVLTKTEWACFSIETFTACGDVMNNPDTVIIFGNGNQGADY